ncbi:MAG: energy-coupled thiamine transporter ThiT [Bacillota bacterium]|nr:energy-coupled thiamine transporter ThiT [Bacillota bacterium]
MLLQNLYEILKHPTSIYTLLAILLFTLAFIKISRVKLSAKITAQIGLALALATVLRIFKIFDAPYGGSVTLGSMVPILLISFIYGPSLGFLTGFLFGIINFIMGPYVLHPIQVLFDYPLPFMALGLAGYFGENKILGSFIGIFSRFLCHFIAGVVFWASYAPKGMSPYLYSLLYNGTYMLIDGLICIVIISILPLKHLSKLTK